VHGHDHVAKIAKVGGTLIVNPGEVGGWLTGRSSFGLLDTETLEAEIIDL